MFLPSTARFLAGEVMLVVRTLPEARQDQQPVEPLTTPAITFCPYNDSK